MFLGCLPPCLDEMGRQEGVGVSKMPFLCLDKALGKLFTWRVGLVTENTLSTLHVCAPLGEA